MANRYYTSLSLRLGEAVLQGAESHHLATVMRARPGDQICLFNGDGCEYLASVVLIGKKEVTLQIESVRPSALEARPYVEIAAAVPKGDRESFMIEKLTELGIARFVPLTTARSVVVPKPDRLRRAVIEACKQCGRNTLMDIADVRPIADYLTSVQAATHRWVAHVGAIGLPSLGQTGCQAVPGSCRIQVVIGPEGGLTDDEIAVAGAANWQLISLGKRILRIETAAIAVAAYCSLSANSA